METREAFKVTNQRFLDSFGKPLAPPDEVEHSAVRLAPAYCNHEPPTTMA